MDWPRILAYVTEMLDQELLARNEYLAKPFSPVRCAGSMRGERAPSSPHWRCSIPPNSETNNTTRSRVSAVRQGGGIFGYANAVRNDAGNGRRFAKFDVERLNKDWIIAVRRKHRTKERMMDDLAAELRLSRLEHHTRRAIAHKRPFCDGHHIVEVKAAIWVYWLKWANGRVPCLLPLYLWKHLQ
jgi:hypothetical protein